MKLRWKENSIGWLVVCGVLLGCSMDVAESPPSPSSADDSGATVGSTGVEVPQGSPGTTSTPRPSRSRERRSVPSGLPSLKARKRATTVRAHGVRDLTFDDLEFEIERDGDFRDDMLPAAIRALDGKRVILRGFILASSIFQQKGIEQFILVRDNQECCFGPGAFLYHNAQVEMTPPATAEFSIRHVEVEGTFSLKPYVMDGKCYSVFHIQADRVR